MSSRALRKLQREAAEKEIEKQIADATAAHEVESNSEAEEEASRPQPRNAFDMLDGIEDVESSDPEPEGETEEPAETTPESATHSQLSQPSSASKSKKKKKKQKKKTKDKVVPEPAGDLGDEIDRALEELAVKDNASGKVAQTATISWEASATKLLAIAQKNLNPTNEMRSLFGDIALETHDSQPPRIQRRREINLQGGVDIATALTGRFNVASRGKELGALADRRNVFLQGKKEWPLATSGGLSMETALGSEPRFEKHYNVMHNQQYQETQLRFRIAVESMQAERMIELLITNPYHIATLLQVSEITRHQGDHSVSGDLLERALFSFGRSVHSSFPAAVREGNARLDFDKSANRELYLAIWRYVRNLEMRGTWRTAFEWTKMLLQFNTLSDPYGITLMIDQFALRGRQHTQLIELASGEGYGRAWYHLPNIQISLALAYLKDKQPREARKQLAYAMHHYPYVFGALASALEIQPVPKSIWGKLPSTDAEKLYTELYVLRAKDLWNTPEHTALIDEVANTLTHYEKDVKTREVPPRLQISLEEARHIMLLEIPALIALLPRTFTSMPTSSSDVLPPPSSISEFTIRAPDVGAEAARPNAIQALLNAAGTAAGASGASANNVIQSFLNWFRSPAGGVNAGNVQGADGEAAFQALRAQLGGDNVSDEEVVENMMRLGLTANGDQAISPEDLGLHMGPMAGDWDYYEDLVNAQSDEESMPGLEDVQTDDNVPSAPSPPRNPRAAMVEEADEEEDSTRPRQTTLGRAILRRADSEDEEEDAHPAPTHTLYAPTSRPSRSTSAAASNQDTVPAEIATSTDPGPDADPQRVQRYLITTGLDLLKSDPSTLPTYVTRLKVLRKQQQDWLIGIVKQKAGKDVSDRIQNAL